MTPGTWQRACAIVWPQTFGDANVFMDVDNLLAGQRFDQGAGEGPS